MRRGLVLLAVTSLAAAALHGSGGEERVVRVDSKALPEWFPWLEKA